MFCVFPIDLTLLTEKDMNAVVVGGTKGIGLALAHELVKRGFNNVIITGRSAPSSGLPKEIKFVEMDLMKVEDRAPFDKVKNLVGPSLDCAFICAATGGESSGEFDKTTPEDMMSSYKINVVGPMVCAQQFIPLLQNGKQKMLVNVTSRMGSIDDNTSGRYAPYRCSKAALNMFTKSLSIEVPWLKAVSYHPGKRRNKAQESSVSM